MLTAHSASQSFARPCKVFLYAAAAAVSRTLSKSSPTIAHRHTARSITKRWYGVYSSI